MVQEMVELMKIHSFKLGPRDTHSQRGRDPYWPEKLVETILGQSKIIKSASPEENLMK